MAGAASTKALKLARQQRAVELRLRGLPLKAIAALMALDTPVVSRLVTSALDELRARTFEDIERHRELESQRMEALIDTLWDGRADPAVAGQIIRASERRAKLYGLDAPIRIEQKIDTGPTLHLENLTTPELEEYERLLAKALVQPEPAIDVTPARRALLPAPVDDDEETEAEDEESPDDASSVREGC